MILSTFVFFCLGGSGHLLEVQVRLAVEALFPSSTKWESDMQAILGLERLLENRTLPGLQES